MLLRKGDDSGVTIQTETVYLLLLRVLYMC